MRRDKVFGAVWWGLACCVMLLVPVVYAQPDIPVCDPDAPLTNGGASTSPDGRFTVWLDCYAADAESYTVHAYDAQSDETYTLGQLTDTREGVTGDTIVSAFVDRWITDTQVSFRAETGGGTYNWRYVFAGDAATPDSLALFAVDYVSRPRFSPEPDRVIWVDEDGVTGTFRVLWRLFDADEPQELYTGDCLLRDDLETSLSCHMVTAHTNATFTEDGDPTLLLLNIGDSIREVKTVEVRALPDGDLLYTVDGLGSGYAEWVGVDTIAVFNLAFDFDTAGFAGVFLRFAEDGTIDAEEPFSLPNGATLTQRPSWMENES